MNGGAVIREASRSSFGAADLEEIVKHAVDDARVAAERREISLLLEVDETPLIRGDAQRLGQMIDNLLSNAVKFTPCWNHEYGAGADLRARLPGFDGGGREDSRTRSRTDDRGRDRRAASRTDPGGERERGRNHVSSRAAAGGAGGNV